MKKKDLILILVENGWYFARSNKHEIWENNGVSVAVPHSRETSKYVAETILKTIEKVKKGNQCKLKGKSGKKKISG